MATNCRVPDFPAVAAAYDLDEGFEFAAAVQIDMLNAESDRVLASAGPDADNCCRLVLGTNNKFRMELRASASAVWTLETAEAVTVPGTYELRAIFKPGANSLTCTGFTGGSNTAADSLPDFTSAEFCLGSSFDADYWNGTIKRWRLAPR